MVQRRRPCAVPRAAGNDLSPIARMPQRSAEPRCPAPAEWIRHRSRVKACADRLSTHHRHSRATDVTISALAPSPQWGAGSAITTASVTEAAIASIADCVETELARQCRPNPGRYIKPGLTTLTLQDLTDLLLSAPPGPQLVIVFDGVSDRRNSSSRDHHPSAPRALPCPYPSLSSKPRSSTYLLAHVHRSPHAPENS